MIADCPLDRLRIPRACNIVDFPVAFSPTKMVKGDRVTSACLIPLKLFTEILVNMNFYAGCPVDAFKGCTNRFGSIKVHCLVI